MQRIENPHVLGGEDLKDLDSVHGDGVHGEDDAADGEEATLIVGKREDVRRGGGYGGGDGRVVVVGG